MRPLILLALTFVLPASPLHAQTPLPAPVPRGSFDTASQAFGLEISGNTLFVSDHESGVVQLDVGNPDLPALIAARNTPSFARNSALADSILLVADRFSGVRVYRWTGSGNLLELGAVDTPGLALGVDHYGDLAVVADKGSGIQIVN